MSPRGPVLVAACVALTLAAPAAASHSTVDIPGDATLVVSGASDVDGTGYSVASADVNGDGTSDLVVGSHDNAGDDNLGRAYVVFGGEPDGVDLADLGTRGFEIVGSQPGSFLGFDVANAGDVNADGMDDILVGEPWADRGARQNSGSVYLIFGKYDDSQIDAAALGTAGIRIDGATDNAYLGSSVAGAGDVDADGVPDVVLGAPFEGPDPLDQPDPRRSGRAYVLFGKSLTANLDLAADSVPGFRIDGTRPFEYLGRSVAPAGDQNDDGRDDLIVGAPGLEDPVGAAYVVYGKTTTTAVSTLALSPGSTGFTIAGVHGGDETGFSVDGGRDVDLDGLPDLLVGAPRMDIGDNDIAGAAFLVRGSATPADVALSSASERVTRIAGAESFDRTGTHVSFADREDATDVLVGSPEGRVAAPGGTVHVVTGGNSPEDFTIDRIGHRGFAFAAPQRHGLGWAATAADVDGDSVAEYALGAPGAPVADRGSPGAVYLAHAPEGPLGEAPPPARFVSFAWQQKAELGSYCWDGGCVDRMPAFAEAQRAGRGDLAALYLAIGDRPDSFTLTEYREVDDTGRPAGEPRSLRVQLEEVGGGRRYRAVFRVPDHTGDSYLVATGAWSGMDRGEASWFFHLDIGHPYRPMPHPPNAELLTGGERQAAGRTTWNWTNCRALGSCKSTIADFAPRSRPLEPVDGRRGALARIRFHTPYRPDEWRLTRYRGLRGSYPSGALGDVEIQWQRGRADGRAVWEARFRLPRAGKWGLYVMEAGWDGHGTIAYDFRVRLR